MKRVQVIINGRPAAKADVADTFFTRFRGLMGRSPIERGMWIVPCADIHTFFMKEEIDVVFLSKQGEALKIVEAMPKNRMSGAIRGAHSVLELPAHTLREQNCLDVNTIAFVEEEEDDRSNR